MENNFNQDIKPEYCTICEKKTIHHRKIKNKKIIWIQCAVCKNKIKDPIMIFHVLRNMHIYISKKELPIIQG
jgi:hypothetical protein